MKHTYLPLNKRSKSLQKDFHSKQRRTWGGLNPVTRKPPDPKAYNRKKTGHTVKEDDMSGLYLGLLQIVFP